MAIGEFANIKDKNERGVGRQRELCGENEIGSRKKGHRPGRARLVSGVELGMAQRTSKPTLCRALFTIITVTEFYCAAVLLVRA